MTKKLIRRIKKNGAEYNTYIEKLKELNAAGYKVPITGNWGRYQENLYKRYVQNKPDFKDSENKLNYIKDLDNWIAKHPTFETSNGQSINTKDFRNFFIELVGRESTYDKNAKQGKYNGWYQLNPDEFDPKDLHAAAFGHLGRLFNDVITKEDLQRAKLMHVSPQALLGKYWNQQNYVTNYLHRDIDHNDDLNTSLTKYANSFKTNIDYSNYLKDAIKTPYVIVKDAKTLPDAVARARNPHIDYSNRENNVKAFTLSHMQLSKPDQKKFNDKQVLIGDTIWLVPTNTKNK